MMLGYFCKIHTVINNFSPVVGGYIKTFFFLLRRKLFGQSITSASYKGIKFFFRYKDMSAIDETLLRGEYDFIVPVLRDTKSPVIVDIGMNVGDFAVLAMACNPDCKIIGIEAHPETSDVARRNGQMNPGREWRVYNRAAWSNTDTIYLETGSISVSTKVSSLGKLAVQGIDMKGILELIPDDKVDIMKIDIEGAEEDFLCAQPDYLSKIKHLIVEIHPLACDESKVRSVLQQYFSVVEDIQGRISTKPLLHCRNV